MDSKHDRLYDVSYRSTAGQLVLDKLVRTEDGGKEVVTERPPIDPYCYIEASDYSHRRCKREGVRAGGEAPDGFVRVEADHPAAIRDFDGKAPHPTYEADVDFSTRVMVDEDWGVALPEPEDILYFDIEVDDRGAFGEPDEAPDRILSVAAVGGDGEEYYYDGDDERGSVQSFLEMADQYAVLVGWNSLGYDFKYLDNRCMRLGMDVNWGRWVRLDLMPLYDMLARPTETLSLKLEDTAERETGQGKADGEVSPGGGALWDAWQETPELLEEYNMRDADVLRVIDEKYGIVRLLHVICDLCGMPPEDTCYESKYGEVRFAPGQAVDAHLLGVAHERGVPMPNEGLHSSESFPGADVLDPEPGFYDSVATLDYSGMYPNIVRAFNFGPTTWYEDRPSAEEEHGVGVELIEGQSGVFLHPDVKRSIPAEAVDSLVEFREGAADIVDKGVKVINNTLYGVFAATHKRYYKPGMSENITLVGQRLVRLAEEGADRSENVKRVVYGDTDSVMAELDVGTEDPRDLVDGAADAVREIEAVLREWAEDEKGAVGKYLTLDIDDIYRKFYIGDKKKRYFGHRLWDGSWSNEVKITGLEYKQSDVPDPVRDMQGELIRMRLGLSPRGKQDIVDGYKTRLHNGELDEHLAVKKGLGKPPGEYEAKTPPVHVRAALAIRDEFGEEEAAVGSKVGYVKFGPATADWTWAHEGRTGRQLLSHHYSYLWDEKFVSAMDSIEVNQHSHEQSGLGAFA